MAHETGSSGPGRDRAEWASRPDGARSDASGDRRDRLPPPMFPPGERRHPPARERPAERPDPVPAPELEGLHLLEDDPPGEADPPGRSASHDDDPWLTDPFADDALIDVDAPIVREEPPRKPVDFEEVLRGAIGEELEDVLVTGIDDDPHLAPEPPVGEPPRDPHVAELIRVVEHLLAALETRGEAGLRSTPDMSRFEVTLRAYCVGFLAGRERGQG